MKTSSLAGACAACLAVAMARAEGIVHVFILAGQSNMEGKGSIASLEHLFEEPDTAERFALLRTDDGAWTVRDDVFIDYLGRRGPLTVGYGSSAEQIGPELGFGIVAGERCEEPVLLIKAAWGGKSVKADFLPPSEGGPGESYTATLDHIRQTLAELDERFPQLAGRTAQLEGFIFFQGWNDYVDREQRDEQYASYTRRLAAMIRDLRAALGAPDLPVVIGQMGVGGPEQVGPFQAAQAAVADQPDMDPVAIVATAPCYDMTAHALYEADVWKGPDKERFYRIASDRPYHYLGSGKTMYLIGEAFGRAALELVEARRAAESAGAITP